MDVFKKLAVVRRGNGRSGSVVSDDGGDDNNFCYHQLDGDTSTEISDFSMDGTEGAPNEACNGGSTSLYGRRRNSGSLSNNIRNPAVVTSTRFDSDEVFSMVARAMIHRYQHQDMSEQEAIDGTLGNADDLRDFMQTLDHKFADLNAENMDGMNDSSDIDDVLSEIVIKTRSLFNDTLKKMWGEKESILGISMDSAKRHRNETMVVDHDDYPRRRPKTPKNLRMSPMRTSSFNYNNNGFVSQFESLDGEESNGNNNIFQNTFKRPGRWFFPPNKKERLTTTPQSNSAFKKPFPIKAALPKFHFDFGGKSSKGSDNSLIFGDLGCEPKTEKSSQLDEGSSSSLYISMWDGANNAKNSSTTSTYMPPTSPIRKVSIVMKANGNNSGEIDLVD